MFALRGVVGRTIGLGRPFRMVRRLAMWLAVAYVAGTFLQVWLAATRDDARKVQAIVVLGAAQYNGRPSPALRARLDHAINLYDRGIAPLVIVTGGRAPGDRTTEAAASAKYLMAHGIGDAHIRREVQGRDTWESLAATARFLKPDGVRDVVLVTDGYHSARVAAVAKEVGLHARTSPVGGAGPLSRLVRETGAVAVGRVIGFRRLTQITA